MANQTINEDLQKERNMRTFNLEELTNFLNGGVQNTERKRKLGMLRVHVTIIIICKLVLRVIIYLTNFSEHFFLNDPCFKDDVPVEYLSHKEHYEQAIRNTCILFKKIKEWKQISDDNILEIYMFVYVFIRIISLLLYRRLKTMFDRNFDVFSRVGGNSIGSRRGTVVRIIPESLWTIFI